MRDDRSPNAGDLWCRHGAVAADDAPHIETRPQQLVSARRVWLKSASSSSTTTTTTTTIERVQESHQQQASNICEQRLEEMQQRLSQKLEDNTQQQLQHPTTTTHNTKRHTKQEQQQHTNCREEEAKSNMRAMTTQPPPLHTFAHRKKTHATMYTCASALVACALFLLLSFLIVVVDEARCAAPNAQYFEVQPETQYMAPNGADVRMRCIVRNRSGECFWMRNGRAVAPIPRKYAYARSPDDGDCSITLRNVSVSQDDGLWQCQVSTVDLEQESLLSRDTRVIILVAPERPQIKNVVSRVACCRTRVID